MSLQRSAALIAALLTAAILAGCGATPSTEASPTSAERAPAPDSTTAGPSSSTPAAPVTPVNEADLPDGFPAGLPMPAGDYRRTVPDEAGTTLTFGISDERVILDLVAALEAAGFTVTAVDDHGKGWKTWFTEDASHRANIAARDLGTANAWIDYRIEPK